MRDFPDRQSIARLRREGVRSVILHLDRVPSSPQSGAARRQIAGLGLTRRRLGSLLVYEIGSPSAFPPGAGSAAG
jgi:hypothetical protein